MVSKFTFKVNYLVYKVNLFSKYSNFFGPQKTYFFKVYFFKIVLKLHFGKKGAQVRVCLSSAKMNTKILALHRVILSGPSAREPTCARFMPYVRNFRETTGYAATCDSNTGS